jgi:hypothetical protein
VSGDVSRVDDFHDRYRGIVNSGALIRTLVLRKYDSIIHWVGSCSAVAVHVVVDIVVVSVVNVVQTETRT